jgi:hypothetical protein
MSGPGIGEMTGKTPAMGKANSCMVGNFPQRERKRFPVYGSFSTVASVVFTVISPLAFVTAWS